MGVNWKRRFGSAWRGLDMRSEAGHFRLDEIADLNPRRSIRRGDVATYIDMAALPTGQKSIDPSGIQRRGYTSGSKFQNGDTLIARITPCLENGKAAFVDCLNADEVAAGSTEFIVISPKNASDADFVYYLTCLPEFRAYAISRMEGTSGRQRVSHHSLADFQFPRIALEQKDGVAQTLSAIDSKIANNHALAADLEAMARAIFKSWFVDFEPVKAKLEGRAPSGMNADTAALFPEELVESELGLIPNGWDWVPLSSMAEFLNGLALQKFPPTGLDDLPVLKIAQLRARQLDYSKLASRDVGDRFIVQAGDLIFSWSGSLMVDFWAGPKCALNQHLFKVNPKEWASKGLLWAAIHHHIDNFRQIASGKAVTMGHINRRHLDEAKVALPPRESLNPMRLQIDSLTAYANQLEIESQGLAELRDSLLPRLISGKIRLPDAESTMEETAA